MPRLINLVSVVAIWFISYICYNNSLHGDWVYDDNFAVVNNKDILPSTPLRELLAHDFWGQDISKPDSHKSYRPLTVLSFRINYALHNMETYGFHLVNVVLHSTAAVMVYGLAHLVFGDGWVSLISGFMFGLHPIHTEAVSSIVGRAEVLCTIFYLPAIFFFHRAMTSKGCVSWMLHIAFVGCFGFATLSKETGYTVLGVILSQYFLVPLGSGSPVNIVSEANTIEAKQNDAVEAKHNHTVSAPKQGPGQVVRTMIVLFCCGLGYVVLRTWLTTTFTLHNFRNLENPIAFAPARLVRSLSTAHLHTQYLALLILPVNLSADYSFNAIPLVESIGDIRNIHTLLAYTGLIGFLLTSTYGTYCKKQESRKILWLLLFGIFSFLPASNLFFYVGTMLAERLLYIPSVPFCILFAWASVRTVRAFHMLPVVLPLRVLLVILGITCTASLCGWYAWRTHTRNLDWQGEHELFMSALEVCPGSAKVWQNIGILHRRTQKWTEAIEAFSTAYRIEPNYCELDYWSGITYLNMGKTDIALPTLKKSIGCVYTQVQAVTALNKIYSVILASSPNNTVYLQEWGNILATINRTHEASYYHLQAGILQHNQAQHNSSISTLLHALALLTIPAPPSPTAPSMSTSPSMSQVDIACSAHMWLGAGYLAKNNFTAAIEHMRQVAGVEVDSFLLPSPPPSSPPPLHPTLACASLSKQARQALGGLYATKIKSGAELDVRSRLELALILGEVGNIEGAHYQYYHVAEFFASKSLPLYACRVLRYALLNTLAAASQPTYKQLASLASGCPEDSHGHSDNAFEGTLKDEL